MSNLITPTVDQEGNFTGAELQQRGEGMWRHNDQTVDFIHNEVTGSTRHIMEDVELADPDGPGDQDAEYLESLVTLHGGTAHFQQMTEWAATNADPSRIAWFNSALDRGDPASLNAAFDWISSEYAAALDAPEEETQEEVTDVEEWFNSIDDETIDAELDRLLDIELGDAEVEALENASQYFDAGTAEANIIMCSLSIAEGQLSVEDAIEEVIASHGEAAAYRAYIRLQQLLN